MKQFFVALLFLGLYACSNGLSPEDTSLNPVESLKKPTTACANNEYPEIGSDDNWEIEVNWDPDSNIPVTRVMACLLWSHNVTEPLNTLPRGIFSIAEDGGPKATNLNVINVNSIVYDLDWSFVWCDYYILQVKYEYLDFSGWIPQRRTRLWNIPFQNDEHQGATSFQFVCPDTRISNWIEFTIKTRIIDCEDTIGNTIRF